MGDAPVDVMGSLVVLKVLVISQNCGFKGGTEQEVSPVSEAPKYCQEFAVVNIIVAFCLVECLGEKPDGLMLFSVI